MIIKTTKYYCDYCKEELDYFEHRDGFKLTLSVYMQHPQGRDGTKGGINADICKKCANELGFVNSVEAHSFMNSPIKLAEKIEKSQNKLLKILSVIIKRSGATKKEASGDESDTPK